MTRNIDYRIEVATPLLDPRLKQRGAGHHRHIVQRYGQSSLYR
ncbi:polyphosphate kinase [Escherichia coli]|uniref:Polyphosphate kinase n=1 Tax=Escherichia coli TaxID=562 RepID=A0A2X1MI35_ECOLX|nr:polyphosphate kinase [Escherichia coli]